MYFKKGCVFGKVYGKMKKQMNLVSYHVETTSHKTLRYNFRIILGVVVVGLLALLVF